VYASADGKYDSGIQDKFDLGQKKISAINYTCTLFTRKSKTYIYLRFN
jgi:hypothetical protein